MSLAWLASVVSNRRYARWIVSVTVCTLIALLYVRQEHSASRSELTDWRAKETHVPVFQYDDLSKEDSHLVAPKAKGRVLITGGGGMIGKQVVGRLLASGTPITVLDRLFHDDELAAIRNAFPRADLKVVIGDVRNAASLSQAMTKDVVGVIHLAAVSRVLWCLENEADCSDVNVRGTELVLDALKGGWFIQASSREVYGNAKNMPVPEDTPHNPANVYGQSKADAETTIMNYISAATASGSKNINAIMLRFSNVYGSSADHRERLIPAIMTNALSHRPIQIVGGDQNLDMVFIGDVVNAISLAVNRLTDRAAVRDPTYGVVEAFNVGTDTPSSAIKLIRSILWMTNSSSPIQTLEGDNRFPDNYVGSTVKSANELGYKAKVSIDEGLHRLATAYVTETLDYIKHKRNSLSCDIAPSYRIHDILALDGCTGTLAADIDGQPFYAYFDPRKEKTDHDELREERWGWRDEDEPQSWQFSIKKKGEGAMIKLTHEVENPNERSKSDKNDNVVYANFEAADPADPSNPRKEFYAEINPSTGYISLTHSSGQPLTPWDPKPPPRRRRSDMPDVRKTEHGAFRFRLTPFCCPNKAAPWPFFREDPLASGILDQYAENVRAFNASQIDTLCDRLKAAQELAENRLTKWSEDPKPIQLQQVEMPTGRPFDWRFRNKPVCTNLCDHPTLCLDTGDCVCGQASCVARVRFPFGDFANLPYLSWPPASRDWATITEADPAALMAQVDKSSWLNVLRPGARRYLSRGPHFPALNVTLMPPEHQAARDNDAETFDRIQTAPHGCFSADSVMERGCKLISQNYKSDSLVFLPQFTWVNDFPRIGEWVESSLEHVLPKGFDPADMIIPFTFDWGRCQTVLHNLYRVRLLSSTPPNTERVSAWQPMGDVNSPCYYMDQDIVIPARTCLQEQLRAKFGDISTVKPSRQRKILVTFKGKPNGAGSSVRQKLQCSREFRKFRGQLTGANNLEVYWGSLRPGSNYLDTLADAIFCPIPRGTTGWATRGIDVIYAGCIPVLIGDQTHHPYWDVLDWSKFSVQINDYDIEHLEQILLSYTWQEIAALQTNLMLIRNAFLYPNEGNMQDNLKERGPWFYAIHSAALLKKTKYPV